MIHEKLRNGINPEVSVPDTNDDIRTDPLSPFYYPNGTDFTLSDQCENLLRQRYSISYYTIVPYKVTIIQYINGLKRQRNETRYYYLRKYLLGIIMDIQKENTSQVEYKLYHPDYPYRELNLDLCKDSSDNNINKITINIEKKISNKHLKEKNQKIMFMIFLIKIAIFSQVLVLLFLLNMKRIF